MSTKLAAKNTTGQDDSLLLYAEMDGARIRAVQRRLKAGDLALIAKGIATNRPPEDWPALIARDRIRVLAALFPGAIFGYRSAFNGGVPVDGVVYLSHTYKRILALPGLTVSVLKGAAKQAGDMLMQGRDLYFPSEPRLLLENLTSSRGPVKKSAGREAVEARLLNICDSRGEDALSRLRESARALAPTLGFEREFMVLDSLVGSILGTRVSQLTTVAGKARTAPVPYDPDRLALFEKLAAELRATPLRQPAMVAPTSQARTNFAFLESYFSNFIEGTEFDVQEARGFVLDGKPIEDRPKDSHDIMGVCRQALSPAWVNQTLSSGEPVLAQLRARHADQMAERPEVSPGEFKVKSNRAGNTEFVVPKLVRGTLIEGSRILPSVPAGTARALLAMFLVSEVHPFTDGNGRLARLVMNAELSVVGACRIIIPTLFREEYLDCLRVLTREGNAAPYIAAMQKIQDWTAAFDYQDIDGVIARMRACNAFERSLVQFRLLKP
ncbi:Fic family protein [Lacisediminimonas profundi]|uniref:Fic family protein n=1 Tax=Lacisediminimonas profundi TaxID=2603856 RepID=UPI0019D52EFC|nr:Fic family protein [Lacisediminimonas profundi]